MTGVFVIAKTDLKPTPNLPIAFISSFFVEIPIPVIPLTSSKSKSLPLCIISRFVLETLKIISVAPASSAFCSIS